MELAYVLAKLNEGTKIVPHIKYGFGTIIHRKLSNNLYVMIVIPQAW